MCLNDVSYILNELRWKPIGIFVLVVSKVCNNYPSYSLYLIYFIIKLIIEERLQIRMRISVVRRCELKRREIEERRNCLWISSSESNWRVAAIVSSSWAGVASVRSFRTIHRGTSGPNRHWPTHHVNLNNRQSVDALDNLSKDIKRIYTLFHPCHRIVIMRITRSKHRW